MNILIVEDNNTDFALIRGVIAQINQIECQVSRATSLQDAIDLTTRDAFDVALLDLGLPDSWGLKTFLRASQRFGETPIIVLTSLDDGGIATRAVHLGAQDYLIKCQVNANTLFRSLRYIIERRHCRKMLQVERDLALELGSSTDLTQALNKMLDTLSSGLGVDSGWICQSDANTGALDIITLKNVSEDVARRLGRLAVDDPTVKNGKPFYWKVKKLASRGKKTLLEREGIRAFAAVPIMGAERVIALLCLGARDMEDLPLPTRVTIETIAGRVGDVLKRVEVEEAMLQGQRNLRTLFDTVDDLLLIMDADGKILCHNPALERKLGYTESELADFSVNDLYAREGIDKLQEALSSPEEANAVTVDLPLVARDGLLIPAETRITPGVWENKPALFALVRDITRRVQMENALKESEERARTRFKAIPVPTFCFRARDGEFYLDDYNAAAVTITRGQVKRWLGAKINQRFRDTLPDVADNIERCHQTRESVNRETRFAPSPNAAPHDYWVNYASAPPDIVLVHVEDITDLKNAEKALRELNETLERRVEERIQDLVKEISERERVEEALRESEEKYRLLVEQGNDGIVITRHGRIKFANVKMETLIGQTREVMVNRFLHEFVSSGDGNLERLREISLELGEENLPKASEGVALGVNGRETPVELTHKITLFEGAPAVQTFVRDIAERKRAEAEAALRKEQLVQADKMVSLGILVAGVAHEVNNPNNCIMLNTPILRNFWEKTQPVLNRVIEDKEEFLVGGIPYSELEGEMPLLFEGIMDSASRIRDIVSGLKDYARKDTASSRDHADVNAMLKAALTLLANMLKRSTRRLRVTYGDNIPKVWGGARKIEQVLINLIQNACQALNSPDDALDVSTAYEPESDSVVIVVRDEGRGIPRENLRYVTDPFFTTKRETGGTGLGLSISAGIIEDHKGQLSIESETGKGTTVTIRLPAVSASASY